MGDREDEWPWLPPPGPGATGAGAGPEPPSPTRWRAGCCAQRVVLLHGPLDDLSVTRVSAELMTLDAEGDESVTLRVDCGEAALAPALTLMDVVELMGVPVRALCLGQVGAGAIGVVAVCAHRSAMPSTRFSLLRAHDAARGACRATWPSGPSSRRPSAGPLLHARRGRRREAARRRREGPGAREVSSSGPEAVEYGIFDEVSRPGRGHAAACPDGARPWGSAARGPAHGVSGPCADAGHRLDARCDLRCGAETGPRLPPLPAGEWDERLRPGAGALARAGPEEPMHIFATLARASRAVPPLAGLRRALLYGRPARPALASS